MLKQFAKSFLIYGFASGLSRSFLILLVPLYTSLFSPTEYGIVDIMTGFIALMVIIGMLQMESAIARYYYEITDTRKNQLISTAFWCVIVFSTIFSALLFSMANYISLYFFDQSDLQYLIKIACFLIPLSSSFNFLLFLLRYEKKPLLYFGFVIVQMVGTLLAILFFVDYQNLKIQGVLYGQIIGLLLPLSYLIWHFRQNLKPQWSKALMYMLLKYSMPLIPSVAISWANVYFNRFIMLQYFSIAEVGIYSLAARIASCFSLIEVAFTLTWGPFFWNTLAEKKNYGLYHTIFKISCVAIFAAAITGALLSKELVSLFANDNYLRSADILGIIFLSYGLIIFIQMVGMGPSIVKKTYYSTLISSVGLLINISLLVLLIEAHGVMGVAIASMVGSLVTVILFWVVSEKLHFIGYPRLFFLATFFIAFILIYLNLQFQFNFFVKMGLLAFIYLLLFTYLFKNLKELTIA